MQQNSGLSARSRAGFSQKRMTMPQTATQYNSKQALTEQIPRIQLGGSSQRELHSARGSRNEMAANLNLGVSNSSLKTSTQTLQQHPLASQQPVERVQHNATSPYLQQMGTNVDPNGKRQQQGVNMLVGTNQAISSAAEVVSPQDWIRVYRGRKASQIDPTNPEKIPNTIQYSEGQPKTLLKEIREIDILSQGQISDTNSRSRPTFSGYDIVRKNQHSQMQEDSGTANSVLHQQGKISSLNKKYSYATLQEREESHDRIQKVYNIKSPSSYENLQLLESNQKMDNLAKYTSQGHLSPKTKLTRPTNQIFSQKLSQDYIRPATSTEIPSAVLLKTASQRNLQNIVGQDNQLGSYRSDKNALYKAVNSIQQPLVQKSALSASQKKFLTLLNGGKNQTTSENKGKNFQFSKDEITDPKYQQNMVKSLRKNTSRDKQPSETQPKTQTIGKLSTRLQKVISSDLKPDQTISARKQIILKKATSPTPQIKKEKRRQASTSKEKNKINSYRPSTQLLLVNKTSQKVLNQVRSPPNYQRNRPLLQSKFLAQTASTQHLGNVSSSQQSMAQKSIVSQFKRDQIAPQNVAHMENQSSKIGGKSQHSSNFKIQESAIEGGPSKKRDVSDTLNMRRNHGQSQYFTKKSSSDLLKKNSHAAGLAKVRNNYLTLKHGASIAEKLGSNKSIIEKKRTSQTAATYDPKPYSTTKKSQRSEQINSLTSLVNATNGSQNKNQKTKVVVHKTKQKLSPERVLKSHKTDAYFDLQMIQKAPQNQQNVNFKDKSDLQNVEKRIKEESKRFKSPIQSEYLKVENKGFGKTKSLAKFGFESASGFSRDDYKGNMYQQQDKITGKIVRLQTSADKQIGKKVRHSQNMLGIKRHSERKTPKTVLHQTQFKQSGTDKHISQQQTNLSRKYSQDTFNSAGRSLSQLDLQKPLSPPVKIQTRQTLPEDTWQSGCSVDDQNELLSPGPKAQNSARNLPSSSTRGPKALLMKTEQAASQKSIKVLALSPKNTVKEQKLVEQMAKDESLKQNNYWRLSNCSQLCQSHNSISPVISQPTTDQQGVLYIQNQVEKLSLQGEKPKQKSNLNKVLKQRQQMCITGKNEAFGPKSGQIGHQLCHKPASNENSLVVQPNQISTQVDMFEEVPQQESMQNFSLAEMRSILIDAVRKGDLNKVKRVASNYSKDFDLANSLEQQSNGKAAIHIAAEMGHETILEILVRKFGANVNLRDSMGFTPLHYACIQLHRKIIERLLLMKADANMPEKLAGNTPLHLLSMVVGQEKYQEEASNLIEIILSFAEDSKGVQNKDGFFAWQLLPQTQSFLVQMTKPKVPERVTSSEAYMTSDSQSSEMVTASQVQGQAGQRNSATRNQIAVQEITEQAAQRIFTFCEKPSSQQESTESLKFQQQNSEALQNQQAHKRTDFIKVDEYEVQDQYQLKGQRQNFLNSEIAVDGQTGEFDIIQNPRKNENESGSVPVQLFLQKSEEYSSQKHLDTQERNKTTETPGFDHSDSLQNGKIAVPLVTDEHRLIYTSTETLSSVGNEKVDTPPVKSNPVKKLGNQQSQKLAQGQHNKSKTRSVTSLVDSSQTSQRGGQQKSNYLQQTKGMRDNQNQRINKIQPKMESSNSRLMAVQKSPNQKPNLQLNKNFLTERSATNLAYTTDLRKKVDKQVSALHNIIRRSKAQSQASAAKKAESSTKASEGRKRIGPEDFVAHQLLGTGSFGEVFLVQRKTDNKLLAMKVLSKKKIRDQNLKKYALTERNVMSVMGRHPFIVQLQCAFQTRENLYLVSDYCPGGDLSQYLEIEGSFTEEKAKVYIEEILLGIEALHACDIIFRDLKPDNVIIDAEGHAILTDFGLSREQVRRSESGAKSFCGSYAYLAPEMLEKKGHGKAVDWYLLGVILFEMVTGLPPFYADDKEELFQNIVKDHIDMEQVKVEHNLSDKCADLLQHLLTKDPKKRIGTSQGAQEVKQHPFFENTDWKRVYQKKNEMPDPYLAKMAMDIIEQQPYLVAGHPQTVGDVCPRDHKNYFTRWSFVHKADTNLKTQVKVKQVTQNPNQ